MSSEYVTAAPATADLIDAHGESVQSCETQFRQYGGRERFYGEIVTVKCHEDNALVKHRLSEPGQGRVLVVDGGGSLRSALVGDLIAGSGANNGWAGVVVWGAVRDTAELAKLDLGIRALGSNPRKSGKAGAGQLDVPVTFGGVTFRSGAYLYGDEDGVLVSEEALPLR